jgi:hypothetical protein
MIKKMRGSAAALLLLSLTACATSNGILSVNIREGGVPQLHDIYTVMQRHGFVMKKPNSTETYAQEEWNNDKCCVTGAFVVPDDKRMKVIVMYLNDQQKLWLFFDETPIGFDAQSQARADEVVTDLREHFGDQLVITERRNYTGRF